MGFLQRWLTGSLGLGLGLSMAVLAMQAPALTQDYAAALLQAAREARHEIDERIASARQFYAIAASGDDAVVAALRAPEPSNAATLAAALDHARRLQADHDGIEAAPALLRPLVALGQAARDGTGETAIVRRTLVETYTPQVSLSIAAAVYGLGGLLLGTLLAQLLIALMAGTARLAAGRGAAGTARMR
jgi:hypothetical protein